MPRHEADLPSVYTFLDYRAFLKEWFDAKKRANPRFSHRMFARMAGHNSSSLLLQITSGKRNMTAESVVRFAQAMKLDAQERGFLQALVDLDQARSDDLKMDAWRRVSAHRRFREARKLEGEGFRYLSHWYYPAIRELAARPDFDADPAWIAARLRPSVSVAKVRVALEEIVRMGLLVPDEDGLLNLDDASVVTAPEVTDLAVCNYHREMSSRAYDSVAEFEREERHLLGVTVSVPEELIAEVKSVLNEMHARLLDLCDGADGDRDRVYQINLQLFPLSDSRKDA